jgi:spore germination protein GerM
MKRIEFKDGIPMALLAFMIVSMSGCSGPTVTTAKTRTPQPASEKAPAPTAAEHVFKVWFIKEKDGQLEYIGVDRKADNEPTLNDSVKELLNGPNEQEQSDGLRSEVPKGTDLIDVKESPDGLELNLSAKFASDGGSESIETRIEQLRRTVEEAVHDKKVFLDVDGKRLTEAGGEGLEVKQPIN